MGFSKKHY